MLKKIELDSFQKIQQLFRLLGLPGKDMELGKEYEDAMTFCGEKRQAGESGNIDLAAKKWEKEMECGNRIVDILNSRGILQNGILKIKVEKHQNGYDEFVKKLWAKSGGRPKRI